jgi:hypothetical protein
MAKKVKVDLAIGNTKVKVSKDGKDLDVTVDSKNIDVELHKDEDSKEFKYDGKKLDIDIKKDAEGVEVSLNAETGLLKWIGKIISKVVLRRFK